MVYKKDLNLIPEGNSDNNYHLLSTIIFYVLMIGLFITVVGIVSPNIYLSSKKTQRKAYQKKEQQYVDLAKEYDLLASRSTFLSSKKAKLEALDKSHLKVISLLDELEKALPQTVTVNNLSLSQTEVSMDIIAPTNTDIAQLYINLLNSQNLKDVVLSVITTNEQTNLKGLPLNISIQLGNNIEIEGGNK